MIFTEVENCIVGLGPAGMGSAMRFANSRMAKETLCVELGGGAADRWCSILKGKACRKAEPCEILSGVGGASLLSGGKISEYPAGRSLGDYLDGDANTKKALEDALHSWSEYVPLSTTLYSDNVIERGRKYYTDQGFEFNYYKALQCRRNDLVLGYGKMMDLLRSTGINVNLHSAVQSLEQLQGGFEVNTLDRNGQNLIRCKNLIIAIGRSGSNLLSSMNKQMHLGGSDRRIEVGVRFEFPVSLWPDIDACHVDLKLLHSDARTFCVCKNGMITPYRLMDFFLLEGHSEPGMSTGFTNFGISIRLDDLAPGQAAIIFNHVRSTITAQSGGRPIRQMLPDYLLEKQTNVKSHSPSSINYWQWGNMGSLYPQDISTRLLNEVEFFCNRLFPADRLSEISVFGPVMDYFWQQYPKRSSFESVVPGIYMVGDCTGQFRGILQSYCSGIQATNRILGIRE